jgi:hypothetical protein
LPRSLTDFGAVPLPLAAPPLPSVGAFAPRSLTDFGAVPDAPLPLSFTLVGAVVDFTGAFGVSTFVGVAGVAGVTGFAGLTPFVGALTAGLVPFFSTFTGAAGVAGFVVAAAAESAAAFAFASAPTALRLSCKCVAFANESAAFAAISSGLGPDLQEVIATMMAAAPNNENNVFFMINKKIKCENWLNEN